MFSLNLLREQNFLSGVLFMAIGTVGLILGMSYPFGSLQEMGPGFFPRVLSLILLALGGVLILRAFKSSGDRVGDWGWIPLSLLSIALVTFGWVMEHLGLIPALILMTLISVMAGERGSRTEVLLLTCTLCLLAVLIFVVGLGLPYQLFPDF